MKPSEIKRLVGGEVLSDGKETVFVLPKERGKCCGLTQGVQVPVYQKGRSVGLLCFRRGKRIAIYNEYRHLRKYRIVARVEGLEINIRRRGTSLATLMRGGPKPDTLP